MHSNGGVGRSLSMKHAMPIAAALMSFVHIATCVNPIVYGVGMADPHIHVFNDTFYLYSTHDFSVNNTNFVMKDWWIWSSSDLVSWTKLDVLQPNATPAAPADWSSCWAVDAAFHNGNYYWYLSIGPDQVASMRSNSTPYGPWENVLGKPMLNTSFGASLNPPTQIRDPAAFMDDDGWSSLIGWLSCLTLACSPFAEQHHRLFALPLPCRLALHHIRRVQLLHRAPERRGCA